MRKHKNKIIAVTVIVIVLAAAFLYGGNSSGNGKANQQTENLSAAETHEPEKPQKQDTDAPLKTADKTAEEENKPHEDAEMPATAEEKIQPTQKATDVSITENGNMNYSETAINESAGNTDKDKYQTEPVPEGRPAPSEPENTVISDKTMTCTLSVRCNTILDNISRLDKEKTGLVPKDGIIFAEQTVMFYEGESVFNLLLREMKRNKIHMEFENTPIYNSAYIEGIGNLYEFDCGELSGWMYSVNGWFPNYGCSRYCLKQGDKVEWVYTCDLGGDVGGNDSARNGFEKNE